MGTEEVASGSCTCRCTVVAIAAALIPILIYLKIVKPLYKVLPIPRLEETWWGPGKPSEEEQDIKPFKIDVPEGVITDLHRRIDNALPFQEPLEGVKQNYGINTDLLKTIVDYWRNHYSWRESEKFLNQYPQFTVSIQGLKIHYLHVKPTETNGLKVLPLLMIHGWPGSVREFYEIIPLLTTPQPGRGFVFEVVVPSLPGYGFSEAAVRPGLGPAQIAVIFKNLMNRLGYQKYYLQGGDWGGTVVQHIATLFPNKVIGVHSNFCFTGGSLANVKLFIASFYPTLFMSKETASKVFPLSKRFSFMLLEFGYMHIQATKPDTVGVALRESPVGLAAYIIEKFTTWTNMEWKDLDDGGLTKRFTFTKLLDNVMIYWVTRSITTSMRLYAENFAKENRGLELEKVPVEVPSGFTRFSRELSHLPTWILKDKYKQLIHVSDYKDGGHFAAFEVPQTLAEEVYIFTEKVEALHNK